MCNNKKLICKSITLDKKLNDKRDTLFSIVNQNRKVCSFGNCVFISYLILHGLFLFLLGLILYGLIFFFFFVFFFE
jgi:hypothetical protein